MSHVKPFRRQLDPYQRPRIHRVLLLAVSAAVTSVQVARAAQPAGFADAGPSDKLQRRTDLYGDSLPPGAIARMGTVRFWVPTPMCPITFAPDGKTLVSLVSNTAVVWEADSGRLIRRLFSAREAHARKGIRGVGVRLFTRRQELRGVRHLKNNPYLRNDPGADDSPTSRGDEGADQPPLLRSRRQVHCLRGHREHLPRDGSTYWLG